LEYIHVHRTADDGVELLGGTVDIRHLIITGAADDSIDWTFGWRGRMQYALVQQYAGDSDNGIEGDNNGLENEASPRSYPVISHVTLVGSPNSPSSDTGLLLRAGTGAEIRNGVVYGFNGAGLDIDDEETFFYALAFGGLTVSDSVLCNPRNFQNDRDEPFSDEVFFTGAQGALPRNADNEAREFPDCGLGLEDALVEGDPSFTPPADSPLRMGGRPLRDPFFDRVSFRGAVEPGTGQWWTWTRFD
ncbi:MAG: hypothetical protein AAFZ18_33245, partial [Myxococcota bacterium]